MPAFSHCEIPCGIYTDTLGIVQIREDLATVEKSMKMIEELGAVEKKLSNPSFIERAPEAVVEKSKHDATQLREKRERLEAALRGL